MRVYHQVSRKKKPPTTKGTLYVFVLQINVLNLNTDNSLTDFKDVSDEVVKDQDGIVQDYKKSMKKVKEVTFDCKEIQPHWIVILCLE